MTMSKARRHEGTKARRAFSLVEVLLAIIILGIGVISIAALFPAGIAQQRLAADDLMGPIVADHAISIIRSKVDQEDFGSFGDFDDPENWPAFPDSSFVRTLRSDWTWMRPSVMLEDGRDDFTALTQGSIDIFSYFRTGQEASSNLEMPDLDIEIASENWTGWPESLPVRDRLYGIPYNLDKHGQIPPRIIISQQERYYPAHSRLPLDAQDPPQPQYVWDCMFRRYQGRIRVAIFVYRVSAPGAAASRPYAVQGSPGNPLGPTQGNFPPIPVAIDLVDPGDGWNAGGPWEVRYQDDRPIPEVPGFPFDEFDVLDEIQSWQAPRQWILDQNNNVHRVVGHRRDGNDMWIELTRPLSPVRLASLWPNYDYSSAPDTTPTNPRVPSDSPDEYFADPQSDAPLGPDVVFPYYDRGVVTRFWYIPRRVEIDDEIGGEYVLTPVYIAVKEL